MNSPVPAWWNRLTYEEQVLYLQEHPQSQLRVTRRPSNKPQNPAHKAKVAMRYLRKNSSKFFRSATEAARAPVLAPVLGNRPAVLTYGARLGMKALFHGALATSFVAATVFGGDSPLALIGQIAQNATDYFAKKLGKAPIFDENDELDVDGSTNPNRFSQAQRQQFATSTSGAKEPLEKFLAMLFHYLSLPEAQDLIRAYKDERPS